VRVGEAKVSVPALAGAAGYPGGVLHLDDDSRVAGNPAAHFDWPMHAAHSEWVTSGSCPDQTG
jgi:hypothetical protein